MIKIKRAILLELRKKRDITQRKLAKELGISAVFIRKIENYDANPGIKTMIKYQSFFGISMMELFPERFFAGQDKKVI